MLVAAAAVFVFAGISRAAFEAQNIFGIGADSASSGGIAVGSQFDTLDYIYNPALINLYTAKRYTLSLGDYKETSYLDNGNMKYTVLSYAYKNKAYTYLSGYEAELNRQMVIYSLGKKTKKYFWGANIAAFRYSTPARILNFNNLPGDNGSGFTVDIGGYKEFPNKMRAGASIQNMLSTMSNTGNKDNEREKNETLPIIMNFGVSYPIQERIDILAGMKIIKYVTSEYSLNQTDHQIYIGAEFHLPNKQLALRSGYQQNKVFTGEQADKSVAMGAHYQTDKYSAGMAMYNYLNGFNTPTVLTISYKPDAGPWKDAYQVQEPVKPTAAEAPPSKPEYQEPLPSLPQDTPKQQASTDEPKKDNAGKDSDTINDKEELAKKNTQVADFKVEPKIILIPSSYHAEFSDLNGSWSKQFVDNLTAEGYYPDTSRLVFAPNTPVKRLEFYRLMFLTQLTKLFNDPIGVFFKTPYPVSAQAYLVSPKLQQPALLQEGTYEKAGAKRLVINKQMINDSLKDLLKDTDSPAGPYKLRLTVANKDLLPNSFEDYVTVVDTSMDFTSISSKPAEEREKYIDSLKSSLSALGINLDYLSGLLKEIGLTRIEAIKSLFRISDVTPPKEFDKKKLFKDTDKLSDEDQATVFLASRAMRSLDGKPLMGGYSDNTFRPDKEISNAESAALIDRFRRLVPSDFMPPYDEPVVIAQTPQQKNTLQQTETPPSNLIKELPPPIKEPSSGLKSHVQAATSVKQVPAYFVISGSYLSKENAMREIQRLSGLGFSPTIVAESMDGIIMYHTAVGAYATRNQAQLATMNINTDYFIPKVVSMAGAAGSAGRDAVQQKQSPSGGSKQAAAKSQKSQAEIEMKLKGESFIPWNLIKNIDEYEPDTVEQIRR